MQQQLEKRRADQNFRMNVRPIDEAANELAAYLAQYGAERWTRMVILAGPVGRVLELCCNDMGLGPIREQFMAVHELDIMANVVNENQEEEDELMPLLDEEVLAQQML